MVPWENGPIARYRIIFGSKRLSGDACFHRNHYGMNEWTKGKGMSWTTILPLSDKILCSTSIRSCFKIY